MVVRKLEFRTPKKEKYSNGVLLELGGVSGSAYILCAGQASPAESTSWTSLAPAFDEHQIV